MTLFSSLYLSFELFTISMCNFFTFLKAINILNAYGINVAIASLIQLPRTGISKVGNDPKVDNNPKVGNAVAKKEKVGNG